jgi:hypothetical protein
MIMSDISTFSMVSEARVFELCGDVWLRVKAPNGNQGAINLTELSCGPVTRKAFVDWARARTGTDKNVAGSACEPTNELAAMTARAELAERQAGVLRTALEDAAARLHTANVAGAFESGDGRSEYLATGYQNAHRALEAVKEGGKG